MDEKLCKSNNYIIRPASPDDAGATLAIYAPYATDTTISFETEVPPLDTFRRGQSPRKNFPRRPDGRRGVFFSQSCRCGLPVAGEACTSASILP